MGSGGSYLAEYILKNHLDCEVFGLSRWGSTKTQDNIKHIKDKITIIECDLLDLSSIVRALQYCRPDKIFHLAAHANVRVSFDTPLSVLQNNIFSTANLLEAVKIVCPKTIFQMCSTSEVCGTAVSIPISEDHPLNPSNPYAVSKLASEKLSYSYNQCWNIPLVITRAFCYCNPRRYDLFSTSFAMQVARIEYGLQDELRHGNLESTRTMIDVREVAEAYWIASEKCIDSTPYNIGGLRIISVGEFLETLKSKAKKKIISKVDERLLRPSDITNQIPDVSKFENKTGWKPKISLEESIEWLLNECRQKIARDNIM